MGSLRALGIRPADVGAAALVAVVVELNVATGGGVGAARLNMLAYVLGAILAIPVLLRRRWPLWSLVGCTVLLFAYYTSGMRRNISPAPLLSLPLYDAAVAGYLVVAIVIPAVYMTIGVIVVAAGTHEGPVALAGNLLPLAVVLALAVMLGDTVRSRRALAAETAQRLRAAAEEREAEAAARVAGERLRIARDLHDTVAHSMATITVQAGSALHLLGDAPGGVRDALASIRQTSRGALTEMRGTLGQLRGGPGVRPAGAETAGLDRLGALSDAVRAAGAPVSLTVEGTPTALDPGTDHAAYRILQESLTNVLRHAGPDAAAQVCLRYRPDALTISVTDDGQAAAADGAAVADRATVTTGTAAAGDSGSHDSGSHDGGHGSGHDGGHGLTGMRERAAAVGGELTAGPLPDGGFEVVARLPVAPAGGPA